MYKHFISLLFLLVFSIIGNAQELDCSVTVNAQQIVVSNDQIFKTLENALSEFLNQNKWTNIEFKEHEKIKCAFTIILTEQKGTNTFSGSIQVQASRPILNSSYYSPILNHKDDSFTFSYTEFQPLNFNPNLFESNLVSVMSYYTYFILGLYIDTYDIDQGELYLKTALNIANQAQQSGSKGWDNSKTSVTRFNLVDQLLANSNAPFRELYQQYHYDCMDSFSSNQRVKMNQLAKKIIELKEIYNQNPNNFLIRLMMDAKSDEIVNIFKDQGFDSNSDLISVLKKVSSNNTRKWRQIYTN